MRIYFARCFLTAACCLGAGNILLPNTALADALDNWTSQIIATNQQGDGIRDVIYGNGRYVVVGDAPCTPDYGMVITSEEGTQWTVRRNGCSEYPPLYEILAVTYARNVFVAVGYLGDIYSSIDGLSWVQRAQAPFANFNGVAYGNGRFVAVGDGQLISGGTTTTNVYVSLDGTNWTSRNFGFSDFLGSVAFNGSVFVATGWNGDVYRSTLGTSWTATGVGPSISRVSVCNGLFIIPRGIGTNLVSPDGATWAMQTNDSSLRFDRVFYGHGIYLAIAGYTNVFCTSTNGTNWTIRSFPTLPNSTLRGFTFGGPKAVAIASTAAGVVYRVSALTSDPLVGLTALSQPGQLSLTGVSGASYRVDSSDLLGPTGNSWHALTTFTLQGSPYLWTDVTASGVTSRFYRAVLLP
jgi:hypothetical protein